MRKYIILIALIFICPGIFSQISKSPAGQSKKNVLRLVQKDTTISVFTKDGSQPVLVQVSKANNRPYIHPIIAPDGKGIMTEYRPSHHLHQTGLYWGLKLVNGRDFFMNWNKDYYKLVSARIITARGKKVQWQIIDDLLDENGNACLTETHNWTMQSINGRYLLDLEWRGEAKTDITFGKFYVGGLFIRMPWHKGTEGDVVNAVGQRNSKEAEAQRAIWADVGLQIEEREDMGHIAILDHPENRVFPTPWRVDSQMGLGPSLQILSDWSLAKGQTEVIRYRIIVYTGSRNPRELTRQWLQFVREL